MSKRIQWRLEKRLVSELKPYDKNPRIITEEGLKHLKNSFDKIGFAQPININTDNTILSGHARVQQLKAEGAKEVDVYVPDRLLTPKQEEEVIVRMNKNVAGVWDFDILANEFEVDDLVDWGFSLDELGMPEVEQLEGMTDEDAVPEAPTEPITKRGDVWILGNHRLMCGDSTMIDDVEKLMGGKKADMVFTDPPYGVNFQSSQRVKSEKFEVLKNDDSFLDFLPCLEAYTKDNTAWFIWTSHHVYPKWREMYEQYYKSTIIWHKGGGGMGDLKSDYATDFEMALYCMKGKPQFLYNRPAAVWKIGKDASSKYVHPTQKPVELSEYAMGNFLRAHTVVMDLFLGSGSTLIGCEKTNRFCRGMELDEKYCDVIIKRWQEYTGKKAILESTQEEYDTLLEARDGKNG